MSDLSSVQHPVSDLRILAKIRIPGSPDWVGINTDAVWISNKARNNVARIDPLTNRVTGRVGVGSSPCAGLGAGFGSVWVPNCGDGTLSRIDVRTRRVVATIPVGPADSEGGIAVGTESVWLPSDVNGGLARVDPGANQVVSTTPVRASSFAAAAGLGAIWVTSTEHNLVSRLDPHTAQVVKEIPVGPRPRFLAVGENAVWVLNQGDGTVSRIAPETNQVTAVIPVGVPGEGGDIAVGEGFVWVTAINTPLSRIDPAQNRVVSQFVGTGGDAVRVGLGAVWLCSFFLQEVWRVDPASA